ncbi:hypothetical protein ABES03_17140 [Neobacillus rhizosphaerae]|uniref:hypothetical protein n=1 Tax=Neobacillus rhizosphaerae TaxID=2880965 RepID=UPI003D2C9C74
MTSRRQRQFGWQLGSVPCCFTAAEDWYQGIRVCAVSILHLSYKSCVDQGEGYFGMQRLALVGEKLD